MRPLRFCTWRALLPNINDFLMGRRDAIPEVCRGKPRLGRGPGQNAVAHDNPEKSEIPGAHQGLDATSVAVDSDEDDRLDTIPLQERVQDRAKEGIGTIFRHDRVTRHRFQVVNDLRSPAPLRWEGGRRLSGDGPRVLDLRIRRREPDRWIRASDVHDTYV